MYSVIKDTLALMTIILWPVVPLFWIPVHCMTGIFRRLGILTYIIPVITWMPYAYTVYRNSEIILKWRLSIPVFLEITGITIFIAGGILQLWTGKLLGIRGLIGIPEILPDVKGRLIKEGPFSVVRHPTYLAHTLLYGGVFLISGYISVAIITIIDLMVINTIVIPLEEKELRNRFGDEYIEYSKKTRAFLPFLY